MNFLNLILSAFKSLRKNKFRTFLTMLGIIIGVSAVIIMQSIGKGTEADINSRIASLGTNLIMISPAATNAQGVKMDAGSQQSLKIEDVDMIKRYSPSTKFISPVIRSSAQLKYASKNCRSSIMGVSQDYLQIRDIKLVSGAPFTSDDIKKSSKVCMIGKTVKTNLFASDENPLGKIIRVGSVPFTIIGVLKDKGQSGFGQDQDDIVIAPYTSVQNRITGSEYLQQIYVSALNDTYVTRAVLEISSCLRISHRLPMGSEDDFTISTQSEIMETAKSITGTITLLLASIAAISLLVGGIGIMNIMFVSVTERTREIGVRLAIGATSFDVMMQFLIEAIVLTITAGFLGIVFGVLLSNLVSAAAGISTIITTSSILLSFFVSSIIGIFFGWYPARKASKLNPIEALRYE
ncbi:MAG: ABC transporter permease [Bacteroidota bacterium]